MADVEANKKEEGTKKKDGTKEAPNVKENFNIRATIIHIIGKMTLKTLLIVTNL